MAKPIIFHTGINPPPNKNELEVAGILAQHYKTVVEFIQPSRGYKQKTPDIVMDGVMWEIKSPVGYSKRTIEVQVKSALKQSSNIILDGRLTKLDDKIIIKKLYERLKIHRRINRIIFISKNSTVIVINKKI